MVPALSSVALDSPRNEVQMVVTAPETPLPTKRKSQPVVTAEPCLFDKVVAEVRSGLIASVFAEALLLPVDTLKLQQQVHGGSIAAIVSRVLREQGPMGFYRGLIGRLVQTITSNVGFFVWQTLFVQLAIERLERSCQTDEHGNGKLAGQSPAPRKLTTMSSLIVNMLAQQVNRILTTPIDVVANVNQADPNSKGFLLTFLYLARTGGHQTLWRGLGVALLLAFNPALMFTLVEKLSVALSKFRGQDLSLEPLPAKDLFWISGVSKTVATILTYPAIRAKVVMQTVGGSGLWATFKKIIEKEGLGGLYSGVWLMSYKTVLFNALMMALKQKFSVFETKRKKLALRRASIVDGAWRKQVTVVTGTDAPWEAASRGATVGYVDGSWSFLHPSQQHVLREAAARCDYLVVGVHGDECLREITGSWPSEDFQVRMDRLRTHTKTTAILAGAPWVVGEDLIMQLGASKVFSGSITKTIDCGSPNKGQTVSEERDSSPGSGPEGELSEKDPYEQCKRLGIYDEITSLDKVSEVDFFEKAQKVFFSNVDASTDWRILVRDGGRSPTWGNNPGYKQQVNVLPQEIQERRSLSTPSRGRTRTR